MTKTHTTPPASPSATSPSGQATTTTPTARKAKRKRRSPVDTAKQYRTLHFPAIKDEDVWDRDRGGWASPVRVKIVVA